MATKSTIVWWMSMGGLVALPSLSTLARAQAPATVDVSVDATKAGTPLERVWPFHGYDEVNYTTVPEGEALLAAIAAAHAAPIHVRNHFLLNTGDGTPAMKWGSTNVYTEDAAGNPVYTWTLTDGIMDAITGVGAFPFVEIGFMPEALSTHPAPYQNSSTLSLDGGCFYPPSDYTKWADLISTWAMHANARYPNVAASWLWELWNEPDIGYWKGTFADYANLYDYTESALHTVLPNASLGGPAVSVPGGSFLTQFLQHCATGTNAVTGGAGTRLDLVTFHAKGGTAIVGDHVEMDLGNQIRLHRAGFEAVAASQFAETPIYVTEADPDGCAACPVSDTPADAYRTSTAYGAYEIAMMKHSLELEAEVGVRLGGLLTWAFAFPGTPYFGGYRVLATNGIHLPVLSAFELLGRLAGTRIPLISSGAGRWTTFLPTACVASRTSTAWRPWTVRRSRSCCGTITMTSSPSTTHPCTCTSRCRRASDRASASRTCASTSRTATPTLFGFPRACRRPPRRSRSRPSRRRWIPSPLVPDTTVAVAANGSVADDFDLPRFGVSLVTIVPAAGASDGGTGSDGGGGAGGQGGSTSPGKPGGGCACRLGEPSDDAANCATQLGVGALIFAVGMRRRRRMRRLLPRSDPRNGTAPHS